MPVDFILACPAKRQFFSPIVFFERDTDRYRFGRETAVPSYHTLALSLLTCEVGITNGLSSHLPWAAWLGSAVYVATDAAKPDEYGIETSTEAAPLRNLYTLAFDLFEDISLSVVAMVMEWDERAPSVLAERIKRSLERGASFHNSERWIRDAALIDAGRIAANGSREFEKELASVAGGRWKVRYDEAEADLDAWMTRVGAKQEVLAQYY